MPAWGSLKVGPPLIDGPIDSIAGVVGQVGIGDIDNNQHGTNLFINWIRNVKCDPIAGIIESVRVNLVSMGNQVGLIRFFDLPDPDSFCKSA